MRPGAKNGVSELRTTIEAPLGPLKKGRLAPLCKVTSELFWWKQCFIHLLLCQNNLSNIPNTYRREIPKVFFFLRFLIFTSFLLGNDLAREVVKWANFFIVIEMSKNTGHCDLEVWFDVRSHFCWKFGPNSDFLSLFFRDFSLIWPIIENDYPRTEDWACHTINHWL